jgi:hypothetical protein
MQPESLRCTVGSDRTATGVEVDMTSPCWKWSSLTTSVLLPHRQRVHSRCQNRSPTENTATD